MIRFLSFDNAYTLAVDYNWFTKADNEVYTDWLYHFEAIENLTDEEILKAACIVYKYSIFTDYYDRNEAINHICFLIAKKSTTIFDFNSFEIEEIESTIK